MKSSIVITLDSLGSFERLPGKSARGFHGEPRKMKAQNWRGDTMTIDALGYTDAQLRALSRHYARQRR